MARAGGQPTGLHELVASGPAFLPHALSGRRVLRRDQMVYLDPCGVVDRYHANAARAVWIGDPPDALAELSSGSACDGGPPVGGCGQLPAAAAGAAVLHRQG